MIADPAKIDDLAIAIQDWNTVRSRLRTPAISRSGAIMQRDRPVAIAAERHVGRTRRARQPQGSGARGDPACPLPDADIRLIPKTGHWAAYESADTVNAMLLEMLARTRP